MRLRFRLVGKAVLRPEPLGSVQAFWVCLKFGVQGKREHGGVPAFGSNRRKSVKDLSWHDDLRRRVLARLGA